MRTSDRQRAAIRRTRQFGETQEQYMQRIAARLSEETGLEVIAESTPAAGEITLRGHRRADKVLIVQISRASAAAAAEPFVEAADAAKRAGMYK
jgi:hypothetical protein